MSTGNILHSVKTWQSHVHYIIDIHVHVSVIILHVCMHVTIDICNVTDLSVIAFLIKIMEYEFKRILYM